MNFILFFGDIIVSSIAVFIKSILLLPCTQLSQSSLLNAINQNMSAFVRKIILTFFGKLKPSRACIGSLEAEPSLEVVFG